MSAKRRVATLPGGTGDVAGSSRSIVQPAGALTSTPSSVTEESPPFHTLVSSWSRWPGITMPSSAVASIATPAAVAKLCVRMTCCPESAVPSSRAARASNGTSAAG